MYKGLTFYNHNASIPYLQPRFLLAHGGWTSVSDKFSLKTYKGLSVALLPERRVPQRVLHQGVTLAMPNIWTESELAAVFGQLKPTLPPSVTAAAAEQCRLLGATVTLGRLLRISRARSWDEWA